MQCDRDCRITSAISATRGTDRRAATSSRDKAEPTRSSAPPTRSADSLMWLGFHATSVHAGGRVKRMGDVIKRHIHAVAFLHGREPGLMIWLNPSADPRWRMHKAGSSSQALPRPSPPPHPIPRPAGAPVLQWLAGSEKVPAH